ncbi:NlpC/P60 family protein [Mycolicibacterium fortuitum]|uniref:C40 family peptidase n=1 Tax=Mycolicibacterium TaxID=1866885 RepID=UPI0032048B09
MAGDISSNELVITEPGKIAQDLPANTSGAGASPGVHPGLTAAVDDTTKDGARAREKVKDGSDKTSKFGEGVKSIDKKGGDGVNAIPTALLSAFGAGASSLLGGAGNPGSGMQLPQVPPSSPGGSINSPLSSPNGAQALSKLLGGDGSMGAGSLTAKGRAGAGGPTSPGSTEYQQRIIELAKQVVASGIPYSWGSGDLNGPTCSGNTSNAAANAAGDYNKTGFDCSALARYLVYQASGVEIPRVSGDQYSAGQLVSAADARPGDLAFAGNPDEHVMIYVGDGQVVEAQQSGTNVMFSDAASRGVTQFVRVVSDA